MRQRSVLAATLGLLVSSLIPGCAREDQDIDRASPPRRAVAASVSGEASATPAQDTATDGVARETAPPTTPSPHLRGSVLEESASADPLSATVSDEAGPTDARTPEGPATFLTEPSKGAAQAESPTIPEAPMGRPVKQSALVNAPGYRPPDDPEMESVVTGRREAFPIDLEFEGGETSAEELARRILEAVERADVAELHRLRLTRQEFEKILWPEFPESRPATGIPAAEAWGFLDRSCLSGANRGLDDWTGQPLRFEGVTYSIGVGRYTNFRLYQGVEIEARTLEGERVVLDFASTLAERNGVWKVYRYED